MKVFTVQSNVMVMKENVMNECKYLSVKIIQKNFESNVNRGRFVWLVITT
jgi:hypothetical protein